VSELQKAATAVSDREPSLRTSLEKSNQCSKRGGEDMYVGNSHMSDLGREGGKFKSPKKMSNENFQTRARERWKGGDTQDGTEER